MKYQTFSLILFHSPSFPQLLITPLTLLLVPLSSSVALLLSMTFLRFIPLKENSQRNGLSVTWKNLTCVVTEKVKCQDEARDGACPLWHFKYALEMWVILLVRAHKENEILTPMEFITHILQKHLGEEHQSTNFNLFYFSVRGTCQLKKTKYLFTCWFLLLNWWVKCCDCKTGIILYW